MIYSITGLFYHSHENDTRYHKDELGLSKIISDKPPKHPCKQERPRFRNGKVWPLSARLAGITKEGIEKSRIKHSRGFAKLGNPKTRKKHVQMEIVHFQSAKKIMGLNKCKSFDLL